MSALAWIALAFALGVAITVIVQCWAALQDDWDEEFPFCAGDCNQGRKACNCSKGQP